MWGRAVGRRKVWECTRRGRRGAPAPPLRTSSAPQIGTAGRMRCGSIGFMTYKIRPVVAEDWELLRELRLAALADPVAAVAFNDSFDEAAARSDEFWRRRAAQRAQGMLVETFIGEDEEDGGRWVGSATVLDEGETAHVVGVYVRPEHRATGLAEEVFRAAEEWACGRPYVRRILLHVHEHNPRAESFYRRMGYVRTGGFVSDPKAPVLKEYEMGRDLPFQSD